MTKMAFLLPATLMVILLTHTVFAAILTSTDVCNQIVNQISDDITKYSFTLNNQSLEWMDLNKLKQKLGDVQKKSIHNHLYQWKIGLILQNDDGSRYTVGAPLQEMQNQSIEEITQQFGPCDSVQSENLDQYVWQCAQDGKASSLSVTTSTTGTLLKVQGQKCLEDECSLFYTSIGLSPLENKLNPDMSQKIEGAESAILERGINSYNEYFKTALTSENQIFSDTVTRLKNYYSNLRHCISGTYVYAIPSLIGFVFPVSTIVGQQKNYCLVETSFEMAAVGNVMYRCQYSLSSLQHYTDQEAEMVGYGQVTYDRTHLSPTQKIEKNECKMYINGELETFSYLREKGLGQHRRVALRTEKNRDTTKRHAMI